MQSENNYVGLCADILRYLCRHGDAEIQKRVDERGVLLTVRVPAPDLPVVLGRKGATIRAIRRVVRVVGALENAGVSIRLLDAEGNDADNQSKAGA